MSETRPAVEAVALRKSYRDFWGRPQVEAVEGLSLRVEPGEVYGLLGPNGSGKSTTVKLLLGLLRPDDGQVRLFGLAPHDPAAKARLGYLPEESYLYGYLTGEESLAFHARLGTLPTAEQALRVAQLLAAMRLQDARRRRVAEYSKGMRRRLGLAQALLHDPALLILDEPTSGLDPAGRRAVKDLLRALADRGRAVLLCSHLLAEVEDVCDRVGILDHGRMLAEGRLADLLEGETSLERFYLATVPPGEGEAGGELPGFLKGEP